MLRKECLQCEKSLEGGGNDIISFIVQNKKNVMYYNAYLFQEGPWRVNKQMLNGLKVHYMVIQ